ncbi:hypothetical protein DLAC_10775 [Tieghemostelium lacteum]|uniref:protein-histidine N-methyltransferase n=1 Tax=Tieghemostelium lacteum TaxID=361077 RepID=A0A151Z475_TIELA|nr:hypothetical protein DLAC_10775 [Tieghemostelium lacteum]|eukprot:KYQ88745.1 hypothetical protein DLAC_10775 [Tieghemostelium lacteum]
MSFKFNFQIEDENTEEIKQNIVDEFSVNENNDIREDEAKLVEYQLKELNISPRMMEVVDFHQNEILFKLIKPIDKFNNETEQMINIQKTDLIPGVYEGGFKLWECSIDIINYLIDNNTNLTGKNVLEIGCGHGLPGIYCQKKGSNVTFQDYNDEVLLNLTFGNFKINCNDHRQSLDRCRFISGDWKHVDKLLGKEKYDLILTSDTLYNINSFLKLHNLIVNHLAVNGIW